MKFLLLRLSFIFLVFPCFSVVQGGDHILAAAKLEEQYQLQCSQPSDIFEHISVLRDFARQCASVVELGIRTGVSTWGILKGLSESSSSSRSYLGVDLNFPPAEMLSLAKDLAITHGIAFQFWQADDLDIDIEPADMLFIDTTHTYCHLTYELEKFSPKIQKYIVMHDTSDPWGNQDQPYSGNYSEYPPHINRVKRGLWPAVEDFLLNNREWKLLERRVNNHGLTTLIRTNVRD